MSLDLERHVHPVSAARTASAGYRVHEVAVDMFILYVYRKHLIEHDASISIPISASRSTWIPHPYLRSTPQLNAGLIASL